MAKEVAEFGIKVTIIEPGGFATRSGKNPDPLDNGFMAARHPAYDALRQRLAAFTGNQPAGDPKAAADAILELADLENPPVRILFGTGFYPMVQQAYAERLRTWSDWHELSERAMGGSRPASVELGPQHEECARRPPGGTGSPGQRGVSAESCGAVSEWLSTRLTGVTALLGLGARLRLARLYLCTDARTDTGDLAEFLAAVLHGGVDVVQIRQPGLDPDREAAALEIARAAAERYQALVVVHGSPELAARVGGDVLHLGPKDGSSREARARCTGTR